MTHDEKYTSDELVCLAEHLQIKLKKLLPKEAPDSVNRIFEKLKELFPTTDRTTLLNKSRNHAQKHNDKESELDLTEVIEDILSCSPRSNECKIFPFYPDKYHSFEETNVSHFYTASSQFYKMSLQNPPITAKQINNPFHAIRSIEYIENEGNTEKYRHCKKLFSKKSDKCGKEILLFHGTNVQNIDSIFTTNFNIDKSPVDRRKMMAYGRGVYLSEFPGVSLTYGAGLVLCKVLLGSVETISMDGPRTQVIGETFDSREVVKDGVTTMYVIKNTDQILPYCVINLQNVHNNNTPTIGVIPKNYLTVPSMNNMMMGTVYSNTNNLPAYTPSHPFSINNPSPHTNTPNPYPSINNPPPPAHTPILYTNQPASQRNFPKPQQLAHANNLQGQQVQHTSTPPYRVLNALQSLKDQMNISINIGTSTPNNQALAQASSNSSSQGTSNMNTGSYIQHFTLASAPVSNSADKDDEYGKKLSELKKFVEPLKKKLENTEPTQYKKLQKLLELITCPGKKKISLDVLLSCEKALKKCLS